MSYDKDKFLWVRSGVNMQCPTYFIDKKLWRKSSMVRQKALYRKMGNAQTFI